MATRAVLLATFASIFHVSARTTCYIGNVAVHSGQAKYLVPDNTVYAECNPSTGKAECFLEPLEADVPGIPTPCPDPSDKRRDLGVFLPESRQLWTRGTVCFQINESSNFTDPQIEVIMKAMDHIEFQSNVRFITRRDCLTRYQDQHDWLCGGNCSNYVHLQTANGTTCSSNVGMLNYGEQYINLSPRCFKASRKGTEEGTIIHELGHSLGLKHEHQHRLRQVVVLHDRMSVAPSNFIMLKDMANSQYDLKSIMHYGSNSLCVPLDECPDSMSVDDEDETMYDIKDREWVDTIDTPPMDCIPRGTVFCDAVETPDVHNCTIATIEMCKTNSGVSFGQRRRLSPGDIGTLYKMYPHPPLRSAETKTRLASLRSYKRRLGFH